MGETVMRRKGPAAQLPSLLSPVLSPALAGGTTIAHPPTHHQKRLRLPADEPAEEPAVEAGDVAEGDVDTAIEEEESTVAYGGSISVGLEAEATGLRPWEDTCSSPCYNMMISVFDKLIEMDVNGNYVPYLAESLTSNEDFTVWTMTLRGDVTFHNGVELTAQSIADMFPIQQAGAAGSSAIAAANLVSWRPPVISR